MRDDNWSPDFLWGFVGFDDILISFLTIFECITLESWSTVMYWVRVCCGLHASLLCCTAPDTLCGVATRCKTLTIALPEPSTLLCSCCWAPSCCST